jgi:hypothetical protein
MDLKYLNNTYKLFMFLNRNMKWWIDYTNLCILRLWLEILLYIFDYRTCCPIYSICIQVVIVHCVLCGR